MNFTTDFSRTLQGICLASLVLIIPNTWLQFSGWYGFSPNETPSFNKVIVNQIMNLIPKIIFWIGVFYVTKDKKATLAGFAVVFLGQLVIGNLLLTKGLDTYSSYLYFWTNIIFSTTSLLVFGWIHFKKPIGLLIGLVAIITSGISYGMYSYEYHQVLRKLFDIVGLKEYLVLEIPTGEDRRRIIYPLVTILSQVVYPLIFIIFWFIYSRIKSDQSFDSSLRTISLYDFQSKNTYALVHWILRMALVMAMIGSIPIMINTFSKEFEFVTLVRLTTFCFSIYVIAAIYRNVLLAFYITKKTYPSWFYFFMNIPYIHFIFWFILFFKKKNEENIATPEDILDTVELPSTLVSNAEESQKKYLKEEANSGLKIFIIIALILGGLLQLAGFSNSIYSIPVRNQMLLILFSFTSIVFTLWYMNDSKAMFVIFIIQSITILVPLIFKNEVVVGLAAMSSLINLVIYYPLFHYDKMKFRRGRSEDETQFYAD